LQISKRQPHIAGETIGNVTIDRGAVNALVIRRQTPEGPVFSIAQQTEDGSFNIKPIEAGQPLDLEGPNATVELTVTADGKLLTKTKSQYVSGNVSLRTREPRQRYKRPETEIRNKDERAPKAPPAQWDHETGERMVRVA
jgi:hypothetical protein